MPDVASIFQCGLATNADVLVSCSRFECPLEQGQGQGCGLGLAAACLPAREATP